MPLTNAQTTSFFADANNMAIWNDTVAKLQEEGVEDIDDLDMVDKYFL